MADRGLTLGDLMGLIHAFFKKLGMLTFLKFQKLASDFEILSSEVLLIFSKYSGIYKIFSKYSGIYKMFSKYSGIYKI